MISVKEIMKIAKEIMKSLIESDKYIKDNETDQASSVASEYFFAANLSCSYEMHNRPHIYFLRDFCEFLDRFHRRVKSTRSYK